jgi:hypothetical protein
MSGAARRVVAVPITLVTAGGVAVVVAEIFRGVIFGSSHADPVWLILGGAWAAAMLAATVAMWTGAERRWRPALWTGALALVVGAAVLASGVRGFTRQALVLAVAAALAAGLVAAGLRGPRPESRRPRERSS